MLDKNVLMFNSDMQLVAAVVILHSLSFDLFGDTVSFTNLIQTDPLM